jgi:hypothetical protein
MGCCQSTGDPFLTESDLCKIRIEGYIVSYYKRKGVSICPKLKIPELVEELYEIFEGKRTLIRELEIHIYLDAKWNEMCNVTHLSGFRSSDLLELPGVASVCELS